jgi:DNA-binding transcriptional MerR regulator
MKKYYNKKEAAEALGVSVKTIDNYSQQGLLTALYPGGIPGKRVVFAADEIEKFFSPATTDLVSD